MSLTRIAIVGCAIAGCYLSTASPTDGGSDATLDGQADAQSCPPGPSVGDLPCDVSAVFQSKCQHCHTTPKLPPPDNAPFTLKTYEDLAAAFGTTGLVRWQRVAEVIEPNNFPHMPLPGQPQLTPQDFDVLHAWFDACAPPVPEGTGCDVGEDGGVIDATFDAGDAGDAPD